MELIDQYLEEVQKIHGVYVLFADDDLTIEEKDYIFERFSETLDRPFFIMPKSFMLSFMERYSLFLALDLVKQGHKVTRDEWVKEVYPESETYHTYSTPMARKRAAHLTLNKKGELVKVGSRGGKEKPYVITKEDMDAFDFVVLPKD